MCGFVGDVIDSVVDVIGSVAEFVIDNALPIISTVALNYFAPGLGSFFSISETAVKAIGGAAISALNGGSIASIATAGLMPYISAPGFFEKLGLPDLSTGSFISAPIADFLGNSTVAKIVGDAVGSAATGGLFAAITGDDIKQAALYAGLTSGVSQSLTAAWNTLKETLPDITTKQQQLDSLKGNIDQNKQTLDGLKRFEATINENADIINNDPQYTKLREAYKGYNDAKAVGDIGTANSYARTVNSLAEDMQQNNYVYNTLAPTYNSQVDSFNYLLEQNKGLLDDVMQANTLQKQLDGLYANFGATSSNFDLMDALEKGDFDTASKAYKNLNTYNAVYAQVNPNLPTVSPSISANQISLLDQIASATDDATKNQLYSQASQAFADFKAPTTATTPTTPTETTPTTPAETTPTAPVETTPTTPPTGTGTTTGTSTNPYENLPKLPEDGIGQPTPPTPSTGTGSTGTTTTPSTGSNLGNYLTNVGSNILGNITQGVIGNEIINEILGNKPPTRPTINKPRPPAKVDVGTLRPYTGSLFGESTTTPTTPIGGLPTTPPAKVDPSTLTPYTGSLSVLGQTTPPTNTTTQTPSGGLQSTQTQTPPTKVDVSRLTPVTDANLLKSLGIA